MKALIALGGNLDHDGRSPRRTLEAALIRLGEQDVKILARSRWWTSPAWPDPSKPAYVNGAALLETGLSARALLERLQRTEAEFGRERAERWGSRTLDLDLLDADGAVMGGESDALILPHPRLHERGFVLLPLQEIAPGWRHPVSGTDIDALIAALPETALDGLAALQENASDPA